MSALSTCAQDGSISLNPMSFTEQHSNVLLDRLRYQRDTGRFCDVYIVVKDRHFCAHRNVLAACSPYFDSILKNSKVVKEQVTVNCQNPNVFEVLLNYMYSGNVVIDRSSVTDLLKLANNFLVSRVKNYCAEYLDRNIDATNCISVKELAVKYNLPALFKSATDYFDDNINRCLLESTDIVEFSLAQLNALLAEPKHRQTIEPDVHLKLIVRWIERNPAQRDSLFKEMLSACPFTSVQPSTLESLLDYSPFLIKAQSARFILMETMREQSMFLPKYQAQYCALSSQFGSEQTVYYGSDPVYSKLIETGGSDKVAASNDVEEKRRISYEEASDQPPVAGASTTEEVLNETKSSPSERPSLKLKIQLPLNVLNRKNRILAAASGRHKLYRKSVTTANQMLAKRRGRPPKNRVLSDGDAAAGDHGSSEVLNCVEYIDKVVFDDEDEVDPQLLPKDSDDEMKIDETVSELAFSCDFCDHKSVSASRIRHHINRVHARHMVYACFICPFECSWNRNFYEHMATHYPGPPFRCETCEHSENRITSLLTHRLMHSSDRPFKCVLCDYRCRSKNLLLLHTSSHSLQKPHFCFECGRSFAVKSTLDQHVAAHSEKRPFRCSFCPFTTKYQSHLISHRRIHSGDVFHCHYDDCCYSSPKKSQLAAHLRTHLAVRSHHCQICNRSFIEKSHLVRHERIHLEDKPFKCNNCEYSSSRRDKLKEHIQKHHSTAPGGKQHRRRYRRAKQLAQLAAQAKALNPRQEAQPNMDHVFRPIKPTEVVENASSSALSAPDILPGQAVPSYVLSQSESINRQSVVKNECVSGLQQTHHHAASELTNMANVPALSIGRPSSAVIPAAGAMPVSPALSLNFQIGAAMDSPMESLRTPVPRSPHSVGMHSVTDYFGSSPPSGNQDTQRPMSLPPYGGPATTNNQVGPPWAW